VQLSSAALSLFGIGGGYSWGGCESLIVPTENTAPRRAGEQKGQWCVWASVAEDRQI
jgi:hypothetical protein